MLPLVIEDALKVGFTRDPRVINAALSRMCEQIVALDYGVWRSVIDHAAQPVQLRLQPAGHILGSA